MIRRKPHRRILEDDRIHYCAPALSVSNLVLDWCQRHRVKYPASEEDHAREFGEFRNRDETFLSPGITFRRQVRFGGLYLQMRAIFRQRDKTSRLD